MEKGRILEEGTPLELLLQDPSKDLSINRKTYFA
jgi:hypothetical protein